MLLAIVIVLAFNVSMCISKAAQLPSSFPKCRFSQEDYKECYLNSLQKSFELLKNGLPALRVLPIDPLEVSEISMKTQDGPVAITMTLSNLKIYGFSGIKFDTAGNGLNKGNLSMWCTGKIPELQLISDYKIDGRILILPIVGEGASNITLKNVDLYSRMDNKMITKKDGEDYLRTYTYENDLSPHKVILKLDNLFGGNEELGRQMNVILNQYSEELFKELSPGMKEAFSEIFKQIANQVLGKIPIKHLFTE